MRLALGAGFLLQEAASNPVVADLLVGIYKSSERWDAITAEKQWHQLRKLCPGAYSTVDAYNAGDALVSGTRKAA